MRKHMMNWMLFLVAALTLGTLGSVSARDRSSGRVRERVVAETSVAGETNARLDERQPIALARPGWPTTDKARIDYAVGNKGFGAIRGPWLKQRNVRKILNLRHAVVDRASGWITGNAYAYPIALGREERPNVARGWRIREAIGDLRLTADRLAVRNVKAPWPFGSIWPWATLDGNLGAREGRPPSVNQERLQLDANRVAMRGGFAGDRNLVATNRLTTRERLARKTHSRIERGPLEVEA